MPRDAFVGIDELVPLLDGRFVPYVNLDNAATHAGAACGRSTPSTSFLPVLRQRPPRHRLQVPSEHRGVRTGAASSSATSSAPTPTATSSCSPRTRPRRSTSWPDRCRSTTAPSCSPRCSSTTRTTCRGGRGSERCTSASARTARSTSTTSTAASTEHAGRIALLVVSGASNVTGVVPARSTTSAEKVHAAGGRILVDAAQLAPHRPIDMRPHDDPGHLDFVALSAHKMYAPFGSGALVGSRDAFGRDARPRGRRHRRRRHARRRRTGPTFPTARRRAARTCSARSPSPRRPSALSSEIGWTASPPTSATLLRYAIDGLAAVPGLRLHGPTRHADRRQARRHPVHHRRHRPRPGRRGPRLRARHRRAQRLLLRPSVHRPPARARPQRRPGSGSSGCGGGDKRGAPGMVRISLGCYNDRRDIDRTVAALQQIAAGDIAGELPSRHATARTHPSGMSNRCCTPSTHGDGRKSCHVFPGCGIYRAWRDAGRIRRP